MQIAEITIAVLLGILIIVSSIYLTYFLISSFKLMKERVETGDYYEEPSTKKKVFTIILISYFTLSLCIFGVNLFYRSSPFINNQYYVSIKTDSMSQALSSNTYLKNNNLTNQIAQYNVAVFDKLDDKNINKYDVILFKMNNKLIAHRVVEIKEDGAYITQGDKNPTRDDFEVNRDIVLGKYNHSLTFMSFVNYLGYTPGFYVALTGVTYDIGAILLYEFKKERHLKKTNYNEMS